MTQLMRLANKVAIITGASSGIGRDSAYLFAKEGARIAVADIDDVGGEETVAIIRANGGEAIFVKTDVSIASDVERLVNVTKDKFDRIDILFNNAAIFMRGTPVEHIDESLWERIHAINVKSIFLTTKYVVPEMKQTGGGVIINTASGLANRPMAHYTAYLSAKGAVNTLTKAIALELALYNIRVNCINPGPTQTPMLKLFPKEAEKAIISTVPLGRMTKPEDIAYAALYLASDESAMLTGTSITVDGGAGI